MVKQKCNKRRKRCFSVSTVWSQCTGVLLNNSGSGAAQSCGVSVCAESCSTSQDVQLWLTWQRSVEGCC